MDIKYKLKRLKKRFKIAKRTVRVVVIRMMLPLVRFVPDFVLQCGCIVLGFFVFLFAYTARRTALANLKRAFPEKTLTQRRKIARDCFVHTVLTFFEVLKLPYKGRDVAEKMPFYGRETLDRALARGRGALMVTGHYSNWEAIVWFVLRMGYTGNVVAKKYKFEPFNRLLHDFRASYGVTTIFQQGALRGCLKALKRNEMVGILPDQNLLKVSGVFVDFFGYPALTPNGPAFIARSSGAAVVPIFIRRNGFRFMDHSVYVLDEFSCRKAQDRDQEILENTAGISQIIEDWIRREPAQWVWFHDRWKTRPGQHQI